MGSPPRMRGKVAELTKRYNESGITPAYAGKSYPGGQRFHQRRDHPRVCGEKLRCIRYRPARGGSPPRMRGKVFHFLQQVCRVGITPAYAGKRCWTRYGWKTNRDHPRVCGEKPEANIQATVTLGSPPRMRGKERAGAIVHLPFGITPAYAGKRFCVAQKPCCIWGSPPRMRGKAQVAQTLSLDTGITPAYAGKRLKRSRSTVPPVAIVPLFPSVCNKPVVSDGSPAGRDAPLFLPAENAVPASPAYNLRSL